MRGCIMCISLSSGVHVGVLRVSHDCFVFTQKTAYERRISDWSSDVCSSDLYCKSCLRVREWPAVQNGLRSAPWGVAARPADPLDTAHGLRPLLSMPAR